MSMGAVKDRADRPMRPWKSRDEPNMSMGLTGMGVMVALGIVDLVLAVYALVINPNETLISLLLQFTPAILMLGGSAGIAYFMSKGSREMADWYISFPAASSDFKRLKDSIESYLSKSKLGFFPLDEPAPKSLTDERSGALLCAAYRIKNPGGRGYAVRVSIRKGPIVKKSNTPECTVELLNVRPENIDLIRELADGLAQLLLNPGAL